MRKYILALFGLMSMHISYEQTFDSTAIANRNFQNILQSISSDQNINADSAWILLSAINVYPSIKETGKEYIFFCKDPVFGEVPVRVFIPLNYSNRLSSPLVLLLHGAVGQARFSYVDKSIMRYSTQGVDYTNDVFNGYLCNQNYIVVRPIGDVTKKFDWVANMFKTNPNATFTTLTDIIDQLKFFLNIDDNKVFAFGHSDGSDGAFGLDIYRPSLFAGFVGYNSLLSHIWGQVYLRNMLNKPIYLVHSDLDDIRPIEQTRRQIKILDSIHVPVLYKEYLGYKHEDKHLVIDKPYSLNFLKSNARNPFHKEIYWETDNTAFNNCDWLTITSLDTTREKAAWQSELNLKMLNRITKELMNNPSYNNIKQSGAVKASYNNNTFTVQSSKVGEIELLISPVMVNLQNPVIVTINGKEVFNKRLSSDKTFLLNEFQKKYDRLALWVTSIKLKVD